MCIYIYEIFFFTYSPWFPLTVFRSSWSPTFPPVFSLEWDTGLFVQSGCQLTKCEGQASLWELRGVFPPSWQLRLLYCIYSETLQASLPGPAPLPSGTHSCVWSKSRQPFIVVPAHSVRTLPAPLCQPGLKAQSQSPRWCLSGFLFKYACKWWCGAQLERRFRYLKLTWQNIKQWLGVFSVGSSRSNLSLIPQLSHYTH